MATNMPSDEQLPALPPGQAWGGNFTPDQMRAAQREAFALGAAQGQQEPVAELARLRAQSAALVEKLRTNTLTKEDFDPELLAYAMLHSGPAPKAAQPAIPPSPIQKLDMQCSHCGKPAVSINNVFPSCSCGGQAFEGSFGPAAPVVAVEPVGWLYKGTAPHTRGKFDFRETRCENLESRWWVELGQVCLASPPSAVPAVPEGMALVPIEPTEAMLAAAPQQNKEP